MTSLVFIGVVALAALAGCASTTDVLNATQAAAVDSALARARFEMACPAAACSRARPSIPRRKLLL